MADRFEHPHEDDDAAASADRFADALDLCRLAWDTQKTKARLVKLRKLEKDIATANTRLAAAEAKAAALVAKAHSDVKAIHEAAAQRLEAAESAEEQNALREQKIARLESAWRYIGEPQDVLSGFRSPEFSPLQKARIAHGQAAGKDPDIHGLSEPDAAPAMRIDALSDTSDDPAADRHGVPFLGGLTRDAHKPAGDAMTDRNLPPDARALLDANLRNVAQSPTPRRLSTDEIAKLSPAQRLDYARLWDQSKMPPWRDPRAA